MEDRVLNYFCFLSCSQTDGRLILFYQTSMGLPHSSCVPLPHPYATRCSFDVKSTVQRLFETAQGWLGFCFLFSFLWNEVKKYNWKVWWLHGHNFLSSQLWREVIQRFWTAILMQSVQIGDQIRVVQISIWVALLAIYETKKKKGQWTVLDRGTYTRRYTQGSFSCSGIL